MTRHLTAMELGQLREWKGNKAPKEMFALLAARRAEKDLQPVGLLAIAKFYEAKRISAVVVGRGVASGVSQRVALRLWTMHVSDSKNNS